MPEILVPILTAVAVVAGIGLVCAVMLVIAAKFFAVKVDEKYTELRDCLPGANCGACGYAGCDSYAAAMAEDSSIATNLCIPGGAGVAADLAEVLGVEAGATEKRVAAIHCNGTCDNTDKKADYQGIHTCRAAMLAYGGNGLCNYGCLGYGDCAEVCPVDAINIVDGVARVQIDTCIGCGLCSKTCPKGIISMKDAAKRVTIKCSNKEKGAISRKKCKVACIGCKKCEKTCPTEAISVVDNLATIDYDKCIYCGECAKVCPMHTIMSAK